MEKGHWFTTGANPRRVELTLAFLVTEDEKIIYDAWSAPAGQDHESHMALFDMNLQTHELLPNAEFGQFAGTPYNMRAKDHVNSTRILGYTNLVGSFGNEREEPTVWHKTNGAWVARWISDTSGFVHSLDDSGSVYGQSNTGRASIWDTNLLRTDLPMPTGFTTGKAYGRLRDGRIAGQVYGNGGWNMAIWDSAASMPTVTFFSSNAQNEAPAMSAMDVMLLNDRSNPWNVYTWSPTEGARDLSSQVAGGLPTTRIGQFAGDGGHLIVSTMQNLEAKTWLLTPVPEPTSMIAICAGLLTFRCRRKVPAGQ